MIGDVIKMLLAGALLPVDVEAPRPGAVTGTRIGRERSRRVCAMFTFARPGASATRVTFAPRALPEG
jgi:hypothetical protein